MADIDLGRAKLDVRDKVVAGAYRTIRYTYTCGQPVDDTGCVKIVFRYAGDFGTPQFDDAGMVNYCTVSTDGDCRIEPRWDPKGHTRPWGKALYLKVMGGFLDKGDTITVVFGDTSQGSPGWRMQTFKAKTFEFKTCVDPFATYRFKELPKSPVLNVVPGKPVNAVCIAPSQVRRGKAFDVYLRIEDRWGNAVGRAKKVRQTAFDQCGIFTVTAKDDASGFTAESNPVQVCDTLPQASRWWADFHGQSEETIGSNRIEDYFRYARDCARLDIVAHQGNDFQVTDAFWETVNAATDTYNRPGRLVTFPGYEWSGNTPLGGDRNIYHKTEGGPIYRSSHDLLPDEASTYAPAPTADELFERLDSTSSFAFAHVGGRYADVSMHKEGVEVAMEIHSAWGTFEWLLEDALRMGYRIGVCANSDGHKGRPGASYPGGSRFGSLGGLTCVVAPVLDRDTVFDALHRRHFYATTGHRPLLEVSVATETGTAGMGDVMDVGDQAPMLKVRATGTAPIESVEVRKGLKTIKTVRPAETSAASRFVKVVWSGAEVKGRDRMVMWDGVLRLRGNRIKHVTPVNFWNPDKQPRQVGSRRVEWESITTGGLSGLILELEKPQAGRIEVETLQKTCACDVETLRAKPKVYKAGGLRKQVELFRLPEQADQVRDVSFTQLLRNLDTGDNSVYVKVIQQDGHIAWSSPIYLVK